LRGLTFAETPLSAIPYGRIAGAIGQRLQGAPA
jgi:hypothetical protein